MISSHRLLHEPTQMLKSSEEDALSCILNASCESLGKGILSSYTFYQMWLIWLCIYYICDFSQSKDSGQCITSIATSKLVLFWNEGGFTHHCFEPVVISELSHVDNSPLYSM